MRNLRSGMFRYILASVAVVGLAFGAACDDDGDDEHSGFELSNQQANPQPETVAATIVSDSGEITIEAYDFYFEPQVFSARSGQTIRLRLENNGDTGHSWAIPNSGTQTGRLIAVPVVEPGETSQVIEFTLPSGRWPFECTVHPETMTGILNFAAAD